MRTCRKCGTRAAARVDLCIRHNNMLNRWGTFECQIPGCDREMEVLHKGYCHLHEQRWLKYGTADPDDYALLKGNLPYDRMAAWVEKNGGRRKLFGPSGTPKYNAAEKVLERGARDGFITLPVADHFCIKVLGVHPGEVWPDHWWLPPHLWGGSDVPRKRAS